MNRRIEGALFAIVLVATIVAVDLLFFRNHPWLRLAANVGAAAVFVGLYFAVTSRPR